MLTPRIRLRRKASTPYRGYDFDHSPIHAGPGEEFECSERRGRMLLADYPQGFEVVGVASPELHSAPDDVSRGASTTPEPTMLVTEQNCRFKRGRKTVAIPPGTYTGPQLEAAIAAALEARKAKP